MHAAVVGVALLSTALLAAATDVYSFAGERAPHTQPQCATHDVFGCGSSIEPKALSEPEGWWPSKQNLQVLV